MFSAAVTVGLLGAGSWAQADPETRFELSTWGMPGATRFNVVLRVDGSLQVRRESQPVTPQGPTVRSASVHVNPPDADALTAMASEADDFGAECRTIADGTSARLSVVVAGKAVVRTCDMARAWPAGPKTRRLLERLNALLPGDIRVY